MFHDIRTATKLMVPQHVMRFLDYLSSLILRIVLPPAAGALGRFPVVPTAFGQLLLVIRQLFLTLANGLNAPARPPLLLHVSQYCRTS